jgi:hypothetical protein
MPDREAAADLGFDAMTARLLRREALRRAAEELNTTSGPGLESALARISAEVTAEATERRAKANAAGSGHDGTLRKPNAQDCTKASAQTLKLFRRWAECVADRHVDRDNTPRIRRIMRVSEVAGSPHLGRAWLRLTEQPPRRF